MDGRTLEISGGKTTTDPPPASYKPIPEKELEERVSRPKNLKKGSRSSSEMDGADEKMLPDDERNLPGTNANPVEVKFTSNEKQNGDAKVDIGDLKSTFVGMGKEELMKYANDPFWIRLRWFLFIGFWLLWAGMLFGAIMIIVAAPKCAPPEPRTWWEEGPLTEVELQASISELQIIKDKQIQGVIVSWPEDTYRPLNDSNSFTGFLSRAKEVGVNVIVELEPGTSQIWFNDSTNQIGNFSDYYVWKEPAGSSDPPNNWLSPIIGRDTAWLYSEPRKQFYYSPGERPQLNFRNPNVVEEFLKVLTNFLDAGVKGIRLKGAQFLLVDNTFANETIGNKNGFVGDYGFYVHAKHTRDLPELGTLLRTFRNLVKNKTENGPLMLAENLDTLQAYKHNDSLMIDLPKRSKILMADTTWTSGELYSNFTSVFTFLEKNWPLWESKTEFLPSDVMQTITMLLPGVTLVDKNATIPSQLLEYRKSPSIMYGTLDLRAVSNQTVFAYIRVASGNPGYLVAVNPTEHRVVVDFPEEIKPVSEEVTVQFVTGNYNETDVYLKLKIDAHSVPITAKSAIVLSYVPRSE